MNATDLHKLTSPNLGTYDHDLSLARQRLGMAIDASGYLRDVRMVNLYPLKVAGAVVPGKFWANVKPTDGSKGFRLNVSVGDGAMLGHAFLSFGSCTLSLDLRDADRKAADDAAAAQAQAERKARVDAGRAQLKAEAAGRDVMPSPGHLFLVHGDVLQIPHPRGGFYYWHVGTIRGSALADGRDAAAAVAENARRREARETVASGEMAGAPSWCDDEFLFEAATVLAADGLNMTTRLEREIKGKGLGGALLSAQIGDRVELNGRVFVLALERGHWVKLVPVVQLLEADETTVTWEGPSDALVRDNREAVGAKRGEVTDVEHAVAAIVERGESSALLGGGAAPMMILRLAPPTPRAQVTPDANLEEARALIARSVEHDEIVHAPHTPELHDALLLLCGDYVENRPTVEFWGDDDGEEWRVHLDGFGGEG